MEKIPKELQEKIAELQLLQQRLNIFATQKQTFQLQQVEIESALKELESAKPPVYKLVGETLIEKDIEKLKEELKDRKADVEIRIKSIEKQESATKEKVLELQKEITQKLK